MYESITAILHRELERIDEKYAQGAKEISDTDLDVVDKVTHALKSMGCIDSGTSRDGWSRDGYSGRRGRDSMGRYTSRDGSRDGYYPDYERRGY